jgi:hypothetical protein
MDPWSVMPGREMAKCSKFARFLGCHSKDGSELDDEKEEEEERHWTA